jgi:hypothetical protein
MLILSDKPITAICHPASNRSAASLTWSSSASENQAWVVPVSVNDAGPRGEIRAGSPQGLLPGAPTDLDVPVEEASGSSRCGIAVLHTTELFRSDTPVRHGVLGVVPTPRPQRGTPFAPRGPEGRSPTSTLLWGAATPCHPSRRTSFPSLGDTTGATAVCPPSAPVAEPGIVLELVCRYLRPACSVEMAGSPKFPGEPS